mmetsp:Transcript_8337/g.13992  ORF Transcript_8337/g.13992 Transcript_8337/m.13992 type:complete len:122 (+) Transcript_8337:236-601(+)
MVGGGASGLGCEHLKHVDYDDHPLPPPSMPPVVRQSQKRSFCRARQACHNRGLPLQLIDLNHIAHFAAHFPGGRLVSLIGFIRSHPSAAIRLAAASSRRFLITASLSISLCMYSGSGSSAF